MDIDNATTQFGLPAYDAIADKVRQKYNDTCAIKAQEMVMNAMGLQTSEEKLRTEAICNGWYVPGEGTPMEDVGKLMESHGIEVHRQIHASVFNLVSELSKGHPVIVGVDAGELWHPGADESFEDMISGPVADHALLVGGITFNEDFTGGSVNLIDPGTGHFAMGYDMDLFCDAWDDSDNFMVSIV